MAIMTTSNRETSGVPLATGQNTAWMHGFPYTLSYTLYAAPSNLPPRRTLANRMLYRDPSPSGPSPFTSITSTSSDMLSGCSTAHSTRKAWAAQSSSTS
jgi:hypothetical protein